MRSLAVDLVEYALLAEVLLLRRAPAAEGLIDGDEEYFGEGALEFFRHVGVARAIIVLRRELLAVLGLQEVQIGLRDVRRALLLRHFVDHRDRRLSQD